MAAGWQNKLARVSQMSWDEVRTRLLQEIGKRSDLALYRLGKTPGRRIPVDHGMVDRGKFFFTAEEIQGRVELLRDHLPSEVAAIVSEADSILQHRFTLLGYKNLDYGAEIDWHLDRVHDKRAPLAPWFQIPFLDFAVVGDHKVTWELNRHQHLLVLAKAYLLTKEDVYLIELRNQLRSWVKANPYPLGINWGSSLEVGFRSLSWMWIDHLLAGAPGHTEFRTELLPELAFHGRYIERFLSTYFSPNTHLLGEAVALFFIGTLYPEISGSKRWREAGWNIVLHEAQRQVRPDGVYFEQSLHYHVYALDFFLYARVLAERNAQAVPAEFDATLNRMLDVIHSLSQAGPPEGFGDDDGGRVFNPRRNRTEHMTDPLALGAALDGRKDSSVRLTEESIWMFGDRAITACSNSGSPGEMRSIAFADGGIYILADSHPKRLTAAIDAGPQGTGRSGHGHADALSLRLTVDGQRCLVDPGSGVYISADPDDRNRFRGTAAHNTLRVDGLDQAVPGDPFSWTGLPTTKVENWQVGETFTYFAGIHDGYARLDDPVIHKRSVIQIHDGPCLVRDRAVGKQPHDLEIFWHFSSEFGIHQRKSNLLRAECRGESGTSADPRPTSKPVTLDLIVPESTLWALDVARTQISSAYGVYEDAPLVRAHAHTALPTELATVLVQRVVDPLDRDQQNQTRRLVSAEREAVQTYEFSDATALHTFCFALDKRPWTFGPWFSDAEFLYLRVETDKLVHMVLIGGSSISWHGQPLMKAPRPAGFFEWQRRDRAQFDPDPFTLSPLFYELTSGATGLDSHSHVTSFAEKP